MTLEPSPGVGHVTIDRHYEELARSDSRFNDLLLEERSFISDILDTAGVPNSPDILVRVQMLAGLAVLAAEMSSPEASGV